MTDVRPVSLQLRGLDVQLGHQEILRKIDLNVLPGELFVVLGGEGAGKSTLLRAVAGLDPIARGEIRIDDREVGRQRPQRRGAVLMQPGFPLWPQFTVLRNVTFALRYQGVGRRQRDERAREMLAAVGLAEFERHLPVQLSPGQRQRVALARTLASAAPITLLDEPFGVQGLALRDRLSMMLRSHQERGAFTTLLATEDPKLALRLSDRILVLRNGEVEQVGTARELYDEPVSRHVATLLGRANLIEGEIEYAGDQPLFRAANGMVIPLFDRRLKRARQGWAMFRPHDLALIPPDAEPFGDRIRTNGRVMQTEFRGGSIRYVIDLAGQTVWMDRAREKGLVDPEPGDRLVIGVDPARVRILER